MKEIRKLLEEAVQLSGGWRELIAELDEMPKSESVGKAMWAALDQIDDWKKQALAKLKEPVCKICGGSKRVWWDKTDEEIIDIVDACQMDDGAVENIPCPACKPEEPPEGELKVTLHDKEHQIAGYFRLKDGWIQFATKEKPNDWAWPCSFKWNHHHCDIIDRLTAELKKLTQYRDYVETRIAKCKIPNAYLPLCFKEWNEAVEDLTEDLEQFMKEKQDAE